MKAIRVLDFGGPEVLQLQDEPTLFLTVVRFWCVSKPLA
jgi:hypothetical protein